MVVLGGDDDEPAIGADPGGEVRTGDRSISEIDDVDAHVVALLGLADEQSAEVNRSAADVDAGAAGRVLLDLTQDLADDGCRVASAENEIAQ